MATKREGILIQRRSERAMRKIERPMARTIAAEKNRYINAYVGDFKQGNLRGDVLAQQHAANLAKIYANYAGVTIPLFATASLKQFSRKSLVTFMSTKARTEGLYDQAVKTWTIQNAYKQGRQTAQTTTEDILAVLRKYADEPVTDDYIASELRKVEGLTAFRAATIARTETHNASQFAVQQVGFYIEETLQTEVMKAWVHAEDERTRIAHAEMDANDWIPIRQDFIVGGEAMEYAGDPSASPENVINCRCVIVQEEAQFIG